MACPFFFPDKPLSWDHWQGKLRPPLGQLYSGRCHASGEGWIPQGALLVETCNLGYPAGECPRFPETEGPDAVRFSIASDDQEAVEIAYVLERRHLPCRHGTLRWLRRQEAWSGAEPGSLLHRQAEAYLRSYLRWKQERRRAEVQG